MDLVKVNRFINWGLHKTYVSDPKTESQPAWSLQNVSVSNRLTQRYLPSINEIFSVDSPTHLRFSLPTILSFLQSTPPELHPKSRTHEHIPHRFRVGGLGEHVEESQPLQWALVDDECHPRVRLARQSPRYVAPEMASLSGFRGLLPVQILKLTRLSSYRPNHFGNVPTRISQHEVVRDGRRRHRVLSR